MPRPLQRWLLLQSLVLLLAALLLALPSQASDLGDRSDRYDRDPPTRVARVAELDGRVLWYDTEQRDWQPLMRNQTLAEGDRLRVEEGGASACASARTACGWPSAANWRSAVSTRAASTWIWNRARWPCAG